MNLYKNSYFCLTSSKQSKKTSLMCRALSFPLFHSEANETKEKNYSSSSFIKKSISHPCFFATRNPFGCVAKGTEGKEEAKRREGIDSNDFSKTNLSIQIKKEEYLLETFKRSNQDTCLTHKPAVFEGTWVQSGDFLTDCASSVGGELSLGQNLLIAYMPWEGYNFEDAILISERLVIDDLYTSVHIERYELETQTTKLGSEEITRNIPDASEQDLSHLDSYGIVKIGSWVEEGDILVGKITPINKKKISPYQKLLYTILEKQVRPIKDSSLRAPKGIKAKVIDIKFFLKSPSKIMNSSQLNKNSNSLKTNVKTLKTKQMSYSLQDSLPKGLKRKGIATSEPKGCYATQNGSNLMQTEQEALKFELNNGAKLKKSALSLLLKRKNSNQILLNSKNNKDKLKSNEILFNLKKEARLNLLPFTQKNTKLSEFENKQFKTSFLSKLNFSFSNSKMKKNSFKFYFKYLRFVWLTQNKTNLFRIQTSLSNTKKNLNFIKISSKIQSVASLPFRASTLSNTARMEGSSHTTGFSTFSNDSGFYSFGSFGNFVQNKKGKRFISHEDKTFGLKFLVKKPINKIIKTISKQKKDLFINKIETIHIYLAEKRKIQVGDKMAGRHGNKGIVSQILPIQDMPYLPDGTPIDMVLNPLGVPSRMNVGQIYECLLGLAGKFLGENYKINSFDEIYGPEASRAFVFNKLYEARSKTGFKWLFDPNSPGKIQLFDGRNGLFFDQKVTVGQAYMLRLVHMVDDKIHCLTPDHEILTSEGWLPITEINLHHKIATLKNQSYPSVCSAPKGRKERCGELVYQNPNEIFVYNNYKGFLYVIKNKNINLAVTLNHRMYVKKQEINNKSFNNYQLIEAKDIIGKNYQYLKNAKWLKDDYQFLVPSLISTNTFIPEKQVDMNAWLVFFGIWITQDSTINQIFSNSKPQFDQLSIKSTEDFEDFIVISLNFNTPLYLEKFRNSNVSKIVETNKVVSQIEVCPFKTLVFDALSDSVTKLGYIYQIVDNKQLIIKNKQLCSYLKTLNIGDTNKSLPSWVWLLSQKQAQLLLNSMCLGTETLKNNSLTYSTNSVKLANDIMRLALHAGWSANKYSNSQNENVTKNIFYNHPTLEKTKQNVWSVFIFKDDCNLALKQNDHNQQNYQQNYQQEEVIQYEGPVYCLSVPNEIFYVRRNGIPVWTGNSRSTGPYSLVTQQPLRGRSKQGGQRLGEMEVWALEGYGAAFTLLEMLTIKSDDMTGRMTLWSNLILNKDISIGTPESFKVLVCELQALCLDIGLFRNINNSNIQSNYSNTNLREINNLINLP